MAARSHALGQLPVEVGQGFEAAEVGVAQASLQAAAGALLLLPGDQRRAARGSAATSSQWASRPWSLSALARAHQGLRRWSSSRSSGRVAVGRSRPSACGRTDQVAHAGYRAGSAARGGGWSRCSRRRSRARRTALGCGTPRCSASAMAACSSAGAIAFEQAQQRGGEGAEVLPAGGGPPPASHGCWARPGPGDPDRGAGAPRVCARPTPPGGPGPRSARPWS